jgi:hypothetical protein
MDGGADRVNILIRENILRSKLYAKPNNITMKTKAS